MKKAALIFTFMIICSSLTSCGGKKSEDISSSRTPVTTTVPTEYATETTTTSIDENSEIDPFGNFEFVFGKYDESESSGYGLLNSGEFFDSEMGQFLSDKIGLTALGKYVNGERYSQTKDYPDGTVVTITLYETGVGELDDYIAYAKEKGYTLTRSSIDVVINPHQDSTETTDAE